MTKLGKHILAERAEWERKGYTLPLFDVHKAEERTKQAPLWVHFGAGNIFRSYQAMVAQELLEKGIIDCGIVAAEGFDPEIIERIYRPCGNVSIAVTLRSNGEIEKHIICSVAESLVADPHNAEDWERLKAVFRHDGLQMATFTITEKGYALRNAAGKYVSGVEEDLVQGPVSPRSYMGKVAALLHERYANGAAPLAMVSMDNCSHNGDRLHEAIATFAAEWEQRGVCKTGFAAAYVEDEDKVSFPWTMIDKITPRPNETVQNILTCDGMEGMMPIVTAKNTFVAPFVNAEECQYLVVEDRFPNGRPALEKVGIYMTDRATVDKVEHMKVCTCLNPLHTFLAIFGCLLGYRLICDEMKDDDLRRLVGILGYDEGLPVVVDPGILSPRMFIDEVINTRFPNPFMPDTPQRIACDTSQKLPIRFGETLKSYGEQSKLNRRNLRVLPLVFAGWMRYLMATDDEGNAFELSPDPLLDEVLPYLKGVKLGNTTAVDAERAIAPLLQRADLFGMNLYEAGVATKVVDYFVAMVEGKGAVRRTLRTIK